jgi:hypothetical protein
MTNVMTRPNSFSHHTTSEEQKLYDHFLELADRESPSQLLERFYLLFIDGAGYPDLRISAAVEKLVTSKTAELEFRFILNRCCHILVNRWQPRPQSKQAVSDLIGLFERPPARPISEFPRFHTARRIRELVGQFTQTEQYLTLKRLVQVTDEQPLIMQANQTLGTSIRRYPYLFEHCLLSDDSTQEQQRMVRKVQSVTQEKFESDLSHYLTQRTQIAQIAGLGVPDAAQRLIKPIENPTLLDDEELNFALKHFVGKVEGNATYRDLSQQFVQRSSSLKTYREFKDELYQHLVTSVDASYGKRSFNKKLQTFLKEYNQQNDTQKVNEFLTVRTCSNLLNFLVIESAQKPQHFLFIDLISNIGPTFTTGLLLKVVMLCGKVKPYLEKRFALLFSHYENYTKNSLGWLVKVLENANLALVTNFGSTDFTSFAG